MFDPILKLIQQFTKAPSFGGINLGDFGAHNLATLRFTTIIKPLPR